jgi:EAL domain-containing protein (putative c-di-GMP-specific phosphodiesterase class I)
VTDGERLQIRDLNSTNGTFRNGVRISQFETLETGDLLQFADIPFRLHRAPVATPEAPAIRSKESGDGGLTLCDFDRFLRMRTVSPHFQPIVSLQDRAIVGCEVLARSNVVGLQTPDEMFLAASQLNLEEELSRLLRVVGFERGTKLLQAPCLFINTHAAEIATFGLLDSLKRLRAVNRDQPLTLEIREPAASDTQVVRQLRETLAGLNIRLAYDHFGFGESRRSELSTVRPDYVKFDMHLIRDIQLAPAAQRALLTHLVKMVRDLNIVPVAMGVESDAEDAACRELGFQLGQGFLYGKPAATDELRSSSPRPARYI